MGRKRKVHQIVEGVDTEIEVEDNTAETSEDVVENPELEADVEKVVEVETVSLEVELGEGKRYKTDPVQSDLMKAISQVRAVDEPIDLRKVNLEIIENDGIDPNDTSEPDNAVAPISVTTKTEDYKMMSFLNEFDSFQEEFGVTKETAVKLAQNLLGIRQSGELDQLTISALDAVSTPRDFINDYKNRRKK